MLSPAVCVCVCEQDPYSHTVTCCDASTQTVYKNLSPWPMHGSAKLSTCSAAKITREDRDMLKIGY